MAEKKRRRGKSKREREKMRPARQKWRVFDTVLRDRLLYHLHDNLGKMGVIGGVGVE